MKCVAQCCLAIGNGKELLLALLKSLGVKADPLSTNGCLARVPGLRSTQDGSLVTRTGGRGGHSHCSLLEGQFFPPIVDSESLLQFVSSHWRREEWIFCSPWCTGAQGPDSFNVKAKRDEFLRSNQQLLHLGLQTYKSMSALVTPC